MSAQAFVADLNKDFLVYAQRKQGPYEERPGLLPYMACRAENEGIGPSSEQEKYWEKHWLEACGAQTDNPYDFRRCQDIKAFSRDYATLEEVLKVLEIRSQGNSASFLAEMIGKDVSTTSQQTIFPIFYQAQIQAGRLSMPILDRLLAGMETVNSDTAKHAELSDIGWERGQTTPVGQGARPNTTNIRAVERTVYLQKFMYIAQITYEAMRRQRLPLFATQLQRIGQQLQILLTNYVLNVIISGDGDNAAATTVANSGSAYADIVTAFLSFPQAYSPNMLVANATTMSRILNMPEFKDPLAGFQFQNRGIIPTPLGLDLVRWDVVTGEAPSAYASTTMLMLDTSLAAIGYQEGGGLMVETERVIDSQFEQVVSSIYFGAAVWDRQAARLLTGW